MAWLASRLAFHACLIAAVVLSCFVLFHIVPTDPARSILGPQATEAQVEGLREELGLNAPLATQGARYMASVVRLDFGRSYIDRRLVSDEVLKRLPTTLVLAAMATGIAVGYAFFALWLIGRGRARVLPLLDFAWGTLPTLFSAVLIALLAVHFYPFRSYTGQPDSLGNWLTLLPPAIALALYPMAILSRTIQREAGTREIAGLVRAARARGIPQRSIQFRHVLRNLMVTVLAVLSNLLPQLFTATFIVEIVFSLPGLGALMLKSILQRDLPMLEGIVVVNTLAIGGLYALFDMLYPLVDPRVRGRYAQ